MTLEDLGWTKTVNLLCYVMWTKSYSDGTIMEKIIIERRMAENSRLTCEGLTLEELKAVELEMKKMDKGVEE